MEDNNQTEQTVEKLTLKQKFCKAYFKKENPSISIVLAGTILPLIIIIIMVVGVALFLGWGTVAKPAADLTIKNALSTKNFSATVVQRNNKGEEYDVYTVKYYNGIYYRVYQDNLSVWSFNEDGDTIKYVETSFNSAVTTEKEALKLLEEINPQTLPISEIGETLYLLHKAVVVDSSNVIWMGEQYKTVFGLINNRFDNRTGGGTKNISYVYGAQIEVPNKNIICVAAYQLNVGLKLSRIELGLTSGTGTKLNSYAFNISKQGKSKFDFEFKK